MSNKYFKMHFQNFISLDHNYRNHFSKTFYNNLIKTGSLLEHEDYIYNLTKKDRLCDVIKNKKIPYIITYTNKVKDYYNGLLTKNWKTIYFNKMKAKIQLNGFVKCINNIKYNNIEIHNKSTYIIKKIEPQYVTIQKFKFPNKLISKLFKITHDIYIENFIAGYANTLYSVQGLSIPYDNLIIDIDSIKSNRALYTAISRIRC